MARRGRPCLEDPRDKNYIIRLNRKEGKMLDDVCRLSGMGRSDVFRTALEKMFETEKAKEV